MKSVRTKNYINRPQILIRVWYAASTRIRLPYAYHTRIWLPYAYHTRIDLPYAYHTLLKPVQNVICVTDHVSECDTRMAWSITRIIRVFFSFTRIIRVSPEERIFVVQYAYQEIHTRIGRFSFSFSTFFFLF
jgi:hypothetical protein